MDDRRIFFVEANALPPQLHIRITQKAVIPGHIPDQLNQKSAGWIEVPVFFKGPVFFQEKLRVTGIGRLGMGWDITDLTGA